MSGKASEGSVAEVFAAFLKLGLTSFGGPIAKANRISADGMVKANQAARPPNNPLPRAMPSVKPTWLEAGPGRNWQSATRSA